MSLFIIMLFVQLSLFIIYSALLDTTGYAWSVVLLYGHQYATVVTIIYFFTVNHALL